MSSAAELYDFKTNTVGRSLRSLQKLGVIERLCTPNRVKRALGTWQWGRPDMSLGGIRGLQAAGTFFAHREHAGHGWCFGLGSTDQAGFFAKRADS